MSFGEVVEAVDQLSPEEQEMLIALVRRRLGERERKRLLADVQDARREFVQGGCRTGTVDEIIQEILS